MNKAKKILVIEDEKSLTKIVQDKLKNEGFNVLSADNGQSGLDISFREHPDLILLDIIMPVMDGIEFLEKLRADAWGKNARVIALTNLSDSETVMQALRQGVPDFFVKVDWKLEDLVSEVKQKLA